MFGLRCFSRQTRAASRAPSAYNLFVKDRYAATKTFDLKTFSAEYKAVSPQEKAKYNDMAAKLKADFTPPTKMEKKEKKVKKASGYSLFFQDEVAKANGDITRKEVYDAWKTMSAAEKAPFNQRATEVRSEKKVKKSGKSDRRLSPYFQFVKDNFGAEFAKQKAVAETHGKAFRTTMTVMGEQWRAAKEKLAKSA